ncbi:unnamed protein product, partial [Owenia fusiformis]
PISELLAVTGKTIIHYYDIICIAEVKEDLTNIVLSSEKLKIPMHQYDFKLEFMDASADNLRAGLSYIAYVKASRPDGSPLGVGHNERISFYATTNHNRFFGRYVKPTTVESEYRIPDDGVVVITITNIDMDIDTLDLRAVLVSNTRISAYKSVDKFHTETNNGIQISLVTDLEEVKAGMNAEFKVRSTKAITGFKYIVIARGNIIEVDEVSMSGKVATFSIEVTCLMAPTARIIVFYIDKSEVIADSLEVKVNCACKNDVTVRFNKAQTKPGEEVTVDVTATSGSFVGILAVDQSVLLLKTGNDITQADVLSELGSYDTSEDNT